MHFGWNQIWGSAVIVVGIVWIFKKNIPIGFELRPPSFYAKGKWAIFLGILAIAFGLFIALEIPKQIKIDRCLDSGGKYNYETNECVRE
jgi:hypothetical protein